MSSMESVLLFALIAVPFFGALVMVFFPADRHSLIHWYTRVIAFAGLVMAVYLFVTFDTDGDLSTLPLCLFVVDTEAVADRYVETAEDPLLRLPILVSSMPELAGVGILGRSWRPLWEPDSPTVRLADVAGYSWNRLSRRMERGP